MPEIQRPFLIANGGHKETQVLLAYLYPRGWSAVRMRRNRAQQQCVSEGEFRFGDIVNGNFSHESTLQRVLELVRSDSRSSASKKWPRVKIFKGRQHVLRSGCVRQPTCIISRSGW